MSVRSILKMGDAPLQQARPVEDFTAPWLATLLADLHDTMAEHHGAGLAAPQIGEPWQVVVFGSGAPNPRYPDAEPVPATVLINPILTPLGRPWKKTGRVVCPFPACVGWCLATASCVIRDLMPMASRLTAPYRVSCPGGAA